MIIDTFREDTPTLRRCIEALLDLDAAGALTPHGIGGHARTLLSASYCRLAMVEPRPSITDGILAWMEAREGPVLASEIQEAFGPRSSATLELLIRNGHIFAVFPESKPGDSGRQFWQLVPPPAQPAARG